MLNLQDDSIVVVSGENKQINYPQTHCNQRILFFYVVSFGALSIGTLTVGSICESLALKCAAVYTLTMLPLLARRELEQFFAIFSSSTNYTFGFARAGVLCHIFIHMLSSLLAGILVYLCTQRLWSQFADSSASSDWPVYGWLFLSSTAALTLLSCLLIGLSVYVERRCQSRPPCTISTSASTTSMQHNSSVDLETFHVQDQSSLITTHHNSTRHHLTNQQMLMVVFVGSNLLLFCFSVLIRYQNEWRPVDAVWSWCFSIFLIIVNACEALPSVKILCEASPNSCRVDWVAKRLRDKFPLIVGIHNMRVWNLSSQSAMLLAHIVVDPQHNTAQFLHEVQLHLRSLHPFSYMAIQMENVGLFTENSNNSSSSQPL